MPHLLLVLVVPDLDLEVGDLPLLLLDPDLHVAQPLLVVLVVVGQDRNLRLHPGQLLLLVLVCLALKKYLKLYEKISKGVWERSMGKYLKKYGKISKAV